MYRTFFVPFSPRPDEHGYVSNPMDVQLHNLPVQLTSFIGREQEMIAACKLLRHQDVRLLTLTGTGGIGKTRLSLQVATELLDNFANGVCFVPLAPINNPGFVIPTIAQTLGLREAEDLSPFEHLKAVLGDKQLLLVLDSFEQVVAAAPRLSELLETCPKLKFLVTSRATLHIRGEHEFPVPPLPLPDLTHLPDIEALLRYAAIALFIQRAQAIKPDFQMTDANASAIAEICVRLDGLPLAIELAATRIKILPSQALLARLEQRLQLLTNGAHDVPLRQQTLRNTIAWSYDLLDDNEQRLFRRLSVFAGSCSLEAAEELSVSLGDERAIVLDTVASLIDKSLLQQTQQESHEPRLAMLETISAYGLEQLVVHGEMEVTRRAHAAYFLSLAQEAEPHLVDRQQVAWLERLERDHENLRATLRWLEEQTDRESREQALRLAGALWRFWWIHGYWSEGRSLLSSALKRNKGTETIAASVRAKALYGIGVLACSQNDAAMAQACCGESLALFREIGDIRGIAACLYKLGQAAWLRNNLQTARSLIEQALILFRQGNDIQGIADTLIILALLCLDEGDYAQAFAAIEESLALFQEVGNMGGLIFSLVTLASLNFLQNELVVAHTQAQQCLALSRKVGDRWNIGRCLIVLALVAFAQGEYAVTRTQAEESLKLFKAMDSRDSVALSLFTIGLAAFGQGDYGAARRLCEESLAIAIALSHKEFISIFPVGLAAIAAALGATKASLVEIRWAAQLLGAAEVYRETSGIPLPCIVSAMHEAVVMAVRVQLGEELFAAMWAEGRTLTAEQAIAAQGRSMKPKQIILETVELPLLPVASYPAGLTAREVEVLCWVAMGLTNIQIGERMVISPRTVGTHLSSIYNKLGITSRSAAARFAAEHHLLVQSPSVS